MSRKIVVSIAALCLGMGLFAAPLAPSATAATIDGKIGQGEYANFGDVSGIEFGASLSNDGILSLAVRAPTSGWVAIGLGSGIMDGSWILMAYDDGKQSFVEQLGASHFHKPVDKSKIIAKAVRTEGGKTTLEFTVKLADFVKDKKLPVILAYGGKADFVSRHLKHSVTTLNF